jgi:hypothetical protein
MEQIMQYEEDRIYEKNKRKMDITFDHKAPSIVLEIPQYYNGYKDIMARGAQIRCITEVTSENIDHCKKLQEMVSELRHLDGLKGGIAINESEYMATTVLRHAQPLTEVIYSNVEEVVAQGQYTFDTLWKNAIPARKKILEIEEGIIPIKTKVLDNPEEIAKKLRQITLESDYLNIYSTPTGMALGRDQYESTNENINKKFPDSYVK